MIWNKAKRTGMRGEWNDLLPLQIRVTGRREPRQSQAYKELAIHAEELPHVPEFRIARVEKILYRTFFQIIQCLS
jgi:hypothetical protein